MSEESAQETHDEGIYPETPGHAVPEPMPLKAFAPWHLPRKQWVRQSQWRKCTKRLMRRLQLDDRPLRYLGLPGTELLDLEVLASFCAETNVRFRYLGFNSGGQTPGQQTTQRLAEDLLKSIEGVDTTSIVCTDDILALASKTSLAYHRLKGFESFDVINLDLCDVFTTRRGRSVHAAVKNLIEFQVNGRTHPWLLFVTTTIDREAVAQEDVEQYKNKFEENAARWPDFKEAVGNLAGQPDGIAAGASAFTDARGVRFGKLLAVSIGKWLASVLKQPTPWKVELKSCVCYRRGLATMRADELPVPEPELFSLVFAMLRPPLRLEDPAGLAGDAALAQPVDWNEAERVMALQMARKALHAIDLDLHLQARPDEYLRLTEESATLLAFRNYDIEEYRRFASSVPALPAEV
jgi:hypothetical protein